MASVKQSDGATGDAGIATIAIIGAGEAGRHFASLCLAAGFTVYLEDVMPANLRRAQADLPSAGRLHLALTVEDAVREADVAIDFVPDELESKLEIFSMMDRMAPPRTILCTPTEVLSITDLASCVYRPERCVALRGLPFVGDSIAGTRLGLLYPPRVLEEVVQSIQNLLLRLHFTSEILADPDSPALVKNVLETECVKVLSETEPR